MKAIPGTILALGTVSLLTDLSSEMIYPLLPMFLTTVLGGTAVSLGLIEGFAESTASVMKFVVGALSDKFRQRKPWILAGYLISSVTRPLIGLAQSWPTVMGLRVADRFGKGIRTSPRDALIADVADAEHRGAAYGLHRAMDHAGAVLGPIVAAVLLGFGGLDLRTVFLLAAVPAALSILVIVFGVRERHHTPVTTIGTATPSPYRLSEAWKGTGRDFKLLVGAVLVFTVGGAADSFILLRLTHAGIPPAWIAALWSAHHVVKMISTYVGGQLSDVLGRKTMNVAGWLLYSLCYAMFGLLDNANLLVVNFMLYGLYYGFTEPSERAWVADMVPSRLRATAFGLYNMAVGISALPASVIFGVLWERYSPQTAFLFGGAMSLLATVVLLGVREQVRHAPEVPAPPADEG